MKVLTALYLEGNQIGDVGTEYLAGALQTNQVTKIYISNFSIYSHVDVNYTLFARKQDWNTRRSTLS